jgi:hypothetical protein
MIWNINSIRLVLSMSLVLVLFSDNVVQATQLVGVHPYLIEVFTTADLLVGGEF